MTTTNLTSDEREQRLKRIRERSESRKRVAGKFQWAQVSTQEWADIDFLLFLIDSQAVDNHDSCSHWREGDSDNCVWCGDDLGPTGEADVAGEIPDTATRMRDKCVEKVRAQVGGYCSTSDGSAAKAEILAAVESLTLDQVEQETK